MPSRGSYTIANREEGKAAQRDQSYRSCVLALIIFFLFSILLIVIACFAGKSRSNYPDNQSGNDAVETAKINGRVDKASTSSTSSTSNRVDTVVTAHPEGTDVNLDYVEGIDESELESQRPAKSGKLTDEVSNKSSTESAHTERHVPIDAATVDTDNSPTIGHNNSTTVNTDKSQTIGQTWTTPKTTVQVILGSTISNLPVTEKILESDLDGGHPTPGETFTTTTEETKITEMSSARSNAGIVDPAEVGNFTTAQSTTFYSKSMIVNENNAVSTTAEETESAEISSATVNYSTSLEAGLAISTEKVAISTQPPSEQVTFHQTHSSLNDTEETSEATETTKTSEETETTKTSEETETIATSEATETTKTSEETETIATSEATETTKISKATETTKTSEATEITKPSEATKTTKTSEATKTTKTPDGTETTKTSEAIETTETFSTTVDNSTIIRWITSKPTLEVSAKDVEVVTSSTTEPTVQGTFNSTQPTWNGIEEAALNETQSIFAEDVTEVIDTTTDGREKREDHTVEQDDAPESRENSSISPPTSESISIATISGHAENKVQATTSSSLVESTTHSESDTINVWDTPRNRRMASRMVYYTNHEVKACEDFYEYACGGLEANDLITDNDLSLRVFKTIEHQARKSKSYASARFVTYYESCLDYEANFGFEQRIRFAREAMEEIGKFVTTTDSHDKIQVFTETITKMLERNRPLFFDIMPDVNENRPDKFTLRIGPAVSDKLFQFGPDSCARNHEETEQSDVSLDQLYSDYNNCRDDLRFGQFLSSVNRTLRDIGAFDNLNNTYDTFQYIDQTLRNIDEILVPFPPEKEIDEAYRSKTYISMTLGELQRGWNLLNLTQLIESLTGLVMESNTYLQVYNKEYLLRVMGKLEKLEPLELNNALLALYARNLYQDLVAAKSSRDLQKHCSNMVVHFMAREASELYMSSFNDDKIIHMKKVMRHVFDELKETLRQNIRNSSWATAEGIEELIKKVDGIEMSLPERPAEEIEDLNKLNMTVNYFVNTMKLMKKYRIMIYNVITKKPLDEIWTFFASPFDATAQTIYGLSRIVMPFGAVDWSAVPELDTAIEYLTYATIGNLVAREIAHNFDTNGIRYWNGSKDSEFSVVTGSKAERLSYDAYVDCHKGALYADRQNMTLWSTGQRVSFTMPTLYVNERLSDVAGMRLASDTWNRLRLAAAQRGLPWLNLNVDRLFYLAYAQTHCTKTPLTSSYVSLNEDRFLPSRIRVFVAVSNNNFVAEAWNCEAGHGIYSSPGSTCPTFPHLDKLEDYDEVQTY